MKNNGEFIDLAGERYYAIHQVDHMPPFLSSVVSNADHWLFVSSNGGLTAGRGSPANALFPYVTDDKLSDSICHTGCKTIIRLDWSGELHHWEPFNPEQYGRFAVDRHVYKSALGNKICFEEINHDLQLEFRYTWSFSERYGFVRDCELENLSTEPLELELVDGIRNVLPAGTPLRAQTNTSNLVDAYKWSELCAETGLALFTLYAGISDRAEPCESLKATTAFVLGLAQPRILLSSAQLDSFRQGGQLASESLRRGVRGAYLIGTRLQLQAGGKKSWQIVADVGRSQAEVAALRHELRRPDRVAAAVRESVDGGSGGLAQIVAQADGLQATAEEHVAVHHYANVLFNVLRGGIFVDQHRISAADLRAAVQHFNRGVYARNRELLETLPETFSVGELRSILNGHSDPQLRRLAGEYLPLTFGRRHGDPSRPWNEFSIRVKDARGKRIIAYEGNWRDIFQNWEALLFSYPEFIDSTIAKFVNASTIDGYNPYRITSEGIDWEVEEPDDPWSYIGYWGDHQVIYLLKLLELSRQFHPRRLQGLLRQPIFAYANVPYRIASFASLLEDPKTTVRYDSELAACIEARVADIGADGRLLLKAGTSDAWQVNLTEKLLVTLLAKLGNLIVDGGIWLNTQRPEWNDANNALVGHGLSMVTLYYLRRYLDFLCEALADETGSIELSTEVGQWLTATAGTLRWLAETLAAGSLDDSQRYRSLAELGQAASRYRETVYHQGGFSGLTEMPVAQIRQLLTDALSVTDHSIAANRRDDSLYHAYNLLEIDGGRLTIDRLYLMLEGQVAALSSGAIDAHDAVALLEQLFASSLYRADQHSFMLYPDRELPGFLEKNCIPEPALQEIPLLSRMLERGDERIVLRDADGVLRFNADFRNVRDLNRQLLAIEPDYGDEVATAAAPIRRLYEQVFQHKRFTGRSGTMFGFEGLGCIYWHMVAKLLLAVQENFWAAGETGENTVARQRLGELYYRVRGGLGFNKSPAEYGAFPTDPYSHTPRHAGARQPGMTGQVKEEILCRFGELGVRVRDGSVRIEPALLRAREFPAQARDFRYAAVDGEWRTLAVPAGALAFTWCQVPIVYRLDDEQPPRITIEWRDGHITTVDELALPADATRALFERNDDLRSIRVRFPRSRLFQASFDPEST